MEIYYSNPSDLVFLKVGGDILLDGVCMGIEGLTSAVSYIANVTYEQYQLHMFEDKSQFRQDKKVMSHNEYLKRLNEFKQ